MQASQGGRPGAGAGLSGAWASAVVAVVVCPAGCGTPRLEGGFCNYWATRVQCSSLF